MGESFAGGSYLTGQLLIKPLQYLGESKRSSRTFQIDFAEGITLAKLFSEIQSSNIFCFAFGAPFDKFYGCRDFVIQLLWAWRSQGYTRGEILSHNPVEEGLPSANTNIFEALGYRYIFEPRGKPVASPIIRGMFLQLGENPAFRRMEEGLPYQRLDGLN
ncbi:hypothetical protein PG989_000933 [Apiospora arundinis]